LQAHGYQLLPEDEALSVAWDFAAETWRTLLDGSFDVQALRLEPQLQRLAEECWGAGSLPAEVLTRLAPAYMEAIQAHVRPLDGAEDTLRAVRDRGLHIGLLSNTVWPGAAHRHDLERHGLLPYLEHLVFSADVKAWKPYPEVFQLSLNALGLAPEEAIYVGDSLFFDVWGAQRAGMRGVWVEQARRWLPDGLEVKPDATVKTLPDLLGVIEDWQ